MHIHPSNIHNRKANPNVYFLWNFHGKSEFRQKQTLPWDLNQSWRQLLLPILANVAPVFVLVLHDWAPEFIFQIFGV